MELLLLKRLLSFHSRKQVAQSLMLEVVIANPLSANESSTSNIG
jgi:hypothetical protein